MSKVFQRKPTKNVRTAYNYRPNSSLSDQEKAVNRRLVLSFIFIVAIAGGLYFWGIELVTNNSTNTKDGYIVTKGVFDHE